MTVPTVRTPAQQLAHRLRQYGSAFRVCAILGALVAFLVGYGLGSEGLTRFERDAETTWRITDAVFTWWIAGVVALVQGWWLALISDAVALLLERP